jgi:hypothetical protein
MAEGEDVFSIDVDAESQSFAPALSPEEIKKPMLDGMENIPELPDKVTYGPNVETEALPESIILEPTKEAVDVDTKADSAKVALDLSVKFDPEKSFNSLKTTVSGIQETLEDALNEIQNKKIPITSKSSSFEERALLETTNIVFENRRVRFSQSPIWS